MATLSVVSSGHATLVAATVDTVNLSRESALLEVLNRNGAGELYFTTDGSTPTVAGAETKVVPAQAGASLVLRRPVGATVVKLISSAAVSYSVTGVEG